jgi:hypothetical protein
MSAAQMRPGSATTKNPTRQPHRTASATSTIGREKPEHTGTDILNDAHVPAAALGRAIHGDDRLCKRQYRSAEQAHDQSAHQECVE